MKIGWRFGLVVVGLVLVLLPIASCSEPRADFRGQQVTEAELAARVEAESARLARETADREAAFKIAVAKLDGQRAIDIAELTAKYEADNRALNDALAALQRDEQTARAAIESQWTSRGEWADAATGAVQTASTLFPAFAPFAGVATAAVGLLGWRRSANRGAALKEALRAVTAGVAQLPKPARDYAKTLIGAQADSKDRAVIANVVREDELKLLENEVDAAAQQTPQAQPA